MNIFFIYFGDINFQIFNKKMYEVDTIKLLGKTYKIRIVVFYISKQGLVETFRAINKIENLNMINDLVIQFYELKREKQRQKKSRPMQLLKKNEKKQEIEMKHIALGVVGVISLTVFGFTIKKMFF